KELSRLKKKVAKTEKAEDLMDQLLEAEQKLGRLKKEAAENQNTLQRLEKKLENQNLQGLAQALRQRNLAALKQQMQAIMEKIDGVSDKEKQELLQALQNAAEAAGQKGKISDDPQQSLAALQKQLAKMIKSAGGLQALANAQQQLQHLAKGLNQQMIAAGLAPSGALAFGGNGSLPMGVGQPGSKNGNSSKGGSGSKGGKGSGSGSGTGSGSGFGSGSGSGSGSGGRSGSGSGTGPGSGGGTGGSGSGKGGNGAGFGQGGRNMLTVPENLNGKRNREVDTGELGEGRSEKQIAPGSPILPGQLRPYEEVYGHYETTYRQSMERMDLPEHLQSIVKNYFSDLAPDQ
ncbi:MAG TPA: hypothetical protein VFJ73_00215, partial [Bacillales bacterium]|nr:hypothetical protein [Bacillales bacterium]